MKNSYGLQIVKLPDFLKTNTIFYKEEIRKELVIVNLILAHILRNIVTESRNLHQKLWQL